MCIYIYIYIELTTCLVLHAYFDVSLDSSHLQSHGPPKGAHFDSPGNNIGGPPELLPSEGVVASCPADNIIPGALDGELLG